MNSIRKQCLAATAGAMALWSSPALAQETAPQPRSDDGRSRSWTRCRAAMRTYLDLTASLGYSSNPFLQIGDSQSSAFGRASARGVHAWSGERSQSSVSAFVEGTSYLNDYGLESIFSLDGDTQQQVSEKVSLFGSAGVSGDLAGQLSNRFLYVPPLAGSAGSEPAAAAGDGRRSGRLLVHRPPVPHLRAGRRVDPDQPAEQPVVVGWRSAHLLQGRPAQRFHRHFRQRVVQSFACPSGRPSASRVGVSRTDYENSSDNSTIINPARDRPHASQRETGMLRQRSASPSPTWRAARRKRQLRPICRWTPRSAAAWRPTASAATSRVMPRARSRASVVTTTSVGMDWYKQLDENSTLQLSTSVVRYTIRKWQLSTTSGRTTSASRPAIQRSIGQRLSVGCRCRSSRIASGWAGCRYRTSADRCSFAIAWVTLDDRAWQQSSAPKAAAAAWLINHLPTILWHRRLYVIIPAVLLFVAGLVTAYSLPTLYRSTATMLVESQDLPTDIVQAPGTGRDREAHRQDPRAGAQPRRSHQPHRAERSL